MGPVQGRGAVFRQQLFSPVGKPAQAYIQKRALSMDTVKRFGLGFSPDAWAALTDTMKEKGYRLDELIDAGLSIRGKTAACMTASATASCSPSSTSGGTSSASAAA